MVAEQEWTVNDMRLIDAESVNWGRCPVSGYAMKEWLAEQPTIDAVPVVRCRDCTYMEDAYVCNGFLICPASNMEITDNDFCSYGERKEADGK